MDLRLLFTEDMFRSYHTFGIVEVGEINASADPVVADELAEDAVIGPAYTEPFPVSGQSAIGINGVLRGGCRYRHVAKIVSAGLPSSFFLCLRENNFV